MNINHWTPYFKFDNIDGYRCMSQQTYEPLISPDNKVFCANYDWKNNYQRFQESERVLYTKEVADFFWDKEISFRKYFDNKSWAPNIIDIDYHKKRIFYEWNDTCNELIYSGQSLPSDWKTQLIDIMIDQINENVYKLTMYPHCHFFNKDGQMKTIDFYGCVFKNSPIIEAKYMDAIIHHTAVFRLDETGRQKDDIFIDLTNMFKRSLQEHVLWGNENMNFVYDRIYGD